jgi:hypothetical protein
MAVVVWRCSLVAGTFLDGVYRAAISTDWSIAGGADFNGDGQPDNIWQNKATGERALWLMNSTAYSSGVGLGAIPVQWSIRN